MFEEIRNKVLDILCLSKNLRFYIYSDIVSISTQANLHKASYSIPLGPHWAKIMWIYRFSKVDTNLYKIFPIYLIRNFSWKCKNPQNIAKILKYYMHYFRYSYETSWLYPYQQKTILIFRTFRPVQVYSRSGSGTIHDFFFDFIQILISYFKIWFIELISTNHVQPEMIFFVLIT